MGAVSGAWPGWDEAAGRARCAADQLARQIAFGDDADRHALRRKVAQCHRQWQGKIKVEATRELGVLRAAVLGVRVSGCVFPLTLIAGGFGGAGRDLYDLNAASVLACMLTAAMVASNSRLGLGGVGLLRMIVARGTSVRPRLSEPPDRMARYGATHTTSGATWSRALTRSARSPPSNTTSAARCPR